MHFETSIRVSGRSIDLTELEPERFIMVYNAMLNMAIARSELGWGRHDIPTAYYVALGDFFRRGLLAWSSDGRLVAVDA